MNRQCIITLIAAMSRNRAIGRHGTLPWRMPADLRRFKHRTLGHAVIMGRKTWETLGAGGLPGRTVVVVSRHLKLDGAADDVADSIERAIQVAQLKTPDAREIFIAGGAEIYRQALELADRIDLTLIDVEIADGDAFFPEFETDPAWRLAGRQDHPADERHAHAYAFLTYERER